MASEVGAVSDCEGNYNNVFFSTEDSEKEGDLQGRNIKYNHDCCDYSGLFAQNCPSKLNREKVLPRPMGGKIGGSASAEKDTKTGETSTSVEAHASYKDKNGGELKAEISASKSSNSNDRSAPETKIKAEASYDFEF